MSEKKNLTTADDDFDIGELPEEEATIGQLQVEFNEAVQSGPVNVERRRAVQNAIRELRNNAVSVTSDPGNFTAGTDATPVIRSIIREMKVETTDENV
jgi:hypothetical protein